VKCCDCHDIVTNSCDRWNVRNAKTFLVNLSVCNGVGGIMEVSGNDQVLAQARY